MHQVHRTQTLPICNVTAAAVLPALPFSCSFCRDHLPWLLVILLCMLCRQKDTALHWAAYKGHAEVVQALLQAGANPVSPLQSPCLFDAFLK